MLSLTNFCGKMNGQSCMEKLANRLLFCVSLIVCLKPNKNADFQYSWKKAAVIFYDLTPEDDSEND